MNGTRLFIPFGLLFEEVVPDCAPAVVATYDAAKGVSFVPDRQGQLVPCVEARGLAEGMAGRGASAKVTGLDVAHACWVAGTITVTKQQADTTDKD